MILRHLQRGPPQVHAQETRARSQIKDTLEAFSAQCRNQAQCYQQRHPGQQPERAVADLRRKQGKGQPIRDDGPQSHLSKAGTPTMGGLLILSALMVSTLLWARLDNPFVWIVILVTLAFGLIGFADDYAKVTKQNTKGVSGRVRMGLGLLIAALAAYVFSRNRSPVNNALYFFTIMGIAMPTNFVTLMKVMQVTRLINTQFGIILLYAASSIPFSVFLIYAFIETLPRELDEAAIVDGCSPPRLFFSVIYPLLTPVLVTAGILNLLGIWNEFLLPLYYLNRSTYWPMTLAVYNFFGQFQADWSLVSADILLTILPVIIIYLFAQRFILSGMTAGSVKG